MRFRLQLITIQENGQEHVQELTELARLEQLRPETIGLTLPESKQILQALQQVVVEQQVKDYITGHRSCAVCGQTLSLKGHHEIKLQTVFGRLAITSPRLRRCACQPDAGPKSFSPLAELLPERATPERMYLETLFASLISYGATAKLLAEVLPLEEQLNPTTIRHHLLQAGEHCEQALGEEQAVFVEGGPHDWAELPSPDGPLTVGIDGGYVRAQRGAGWFEVITGKSMLQFKRQEETEEPSSKCFGFVQTYDKKPKRRLFELLKTQGMQPNQQIIFLSDGGDDVGNLQLFLSPEAEHRLDWFHVTMRLTVLRQQALGLAVTEEKQRQDLLEQIERVKHYLWHGNVFQALQHIEFLQMDVDCLEGQTTKQKKLLQGVGELLTYIQNNRAYIPNYGELYRCGETITTSFVESTVNQVVSKRLVKKQAMQWSPRGAHLLLQTRTKVLNQELEATFRQWYPAFRPMPLSEAA
jgi:hypothetical protein